MSITCPIAVPPADTATTPRQRDGIVNAHKFKAYIEEGLLTDSLPLFNGLLNRKKAAEKVGFVRSAYCSNEYISAIADWTDLALKGKPRRKGEGPETDRERELAQENQRLRNRNTELKVRLDDANATILKSQYEKKMIDGGEIQLPWEADEAR